MSVERREPRFSTRVRVRYQLFEGRGSGLNLGKIVEANARNLGKNGLFLGGVSLPRGTQLHFYFGMHDTSIEAFGQVVHDGPRLEASGIERQGVGVRLTFLSPRDRMRLDRFLNDRREADELALRAALVRVRAERVRRQQLALGSDDRARPAAL
jgi:hypothetical protein